ncbi:OmpH family outer membrane protein [Frigoriflavimonas asaccharolytica]|uniref:Outer membrane protein n=1 Tax=Frigoriflavimonas asaccharolytica TaxID=2735899 RepID=A0A8J8G461_9FLAO|nr:OmpH family outer membrane protein [Frigoriflavimonas asaccharolytica]NRS90939.1 outer membrane protein [Frigoriflavimonas asaccharolytica]
MKKLSVLFAAIIMFASMGLKAQKTATLDVTGILNAMPEKKKADTQLEAFQTAKAAEIKKKTDAVQAVYERYQKESAAQSAEVNKTRQDELQKMFEEVKKLEAAAQKELYEKQDAAFAPIEAKFNAAVKKAALANNWEYVMDANSTSLVYKAGPDATPAVKKELGL